MNRRISGFALPSVLIASIIMLDVMLIAVTSTAAVRVSLSTQGYDQLSKMAGEAGTSYAQACLEANGGVAKWTNEKPLKPDTDCAGNQLASCPVSPVDADCHFVSLNDGNNTTFSIGVENAPTINGMKKVSVGENHSCGISSDDLAYCWGDNSGGKLGDGTTNDSRVPVEVYASGVLSGKTILDISANSNHTCVIASDNNAYCWGSNAYGQLGNNSRVSSGRPVAVDTKGLLSGLTIKSISVGYVHTCVIASNNKPYCWGSGGYGQLGNNPSGSSNVAVAVDTSAAPFNTLNAVYISSGMYHTCAIASDNKAYCWGYNVYGQIGNNSTTNAPSPVAVRANVGDVLNGKTVTHVSAGDYHTCAITFDNIAACWGWDSNGQLGNDSATTDSLIAVTVSRATMLTSYTVRSISAGKYHTCAVADVSVYCWGSNNVWGRLGNNSTSQSATPVAVYNPSGEALYQKEAMSVSVAVNHSCVIASDNAYCWGMNSSSGRLGNNSTNNSLKAVTVDITSARVQDIVAKSQTNLTRESDGSTWRDYRQTVRMNLAELSELNELSLKSVAVGDYHTCSISDSNYAYCWGSNSNGQVGDGSYDKKLKPKAVDISGVLSGKTVTEIASGLYHTCAIADGAAYCWGYNFYGQLGDGSTNQQLTPVAVRANLGDVLYGKTIDHIDVGDYHSCAVTSDNIMACWGRNNLAQLGLNSTTPSTSNVPVAVYTAGVLSGKTITSLSLGTYHTCVVASSKAYCWGNNGNGQIGYGSLTNPTLPPTEATGALSGRTVTAVSAGSFNSCAVADNLAFCWGNDNNGQLGDNAALSQQTSPVAVDTSGVLSGRTVTAITSGSYVSCAVADNLAFCWGYNNVSQLGNNSTTNSGVPVQVNIDGYLKNKSITAIDTNQDFVCAVSSETKVYCWGWNADGQFGTNSSDHSRVPVPVYTTGISYMPVGF